jgi:hypothetical protein
MNIIDIHDFGTSQWNLSYAGLGASRRPTPLLPSLPPCSKGPSSPRHWTALHGRRLLHAPDGRDSEASFLMVKRHSDVSNAVAAFADMDRLPNFNGVVAYPDLLAPQKIPRKKGPSCHTFQTLLRLCQANSMPHLLSWLTISRSTKFSGRQHSKFGHTQSNFRQTKPILTTSHPRHFATHKSYRNNHEGKHLTWPRLLMQACFPWRIVCMINFWLLSKINQLASTRTSTSWSMNVVSIILPSPLHQQLNTRPISHHPLATHRHSRNRNHPNHLVLRPISNHPLMILHTFKIRSHNSSSILIPRPPRQQLNNRPISYHPLATHIHSRNRSHPNHLVLCPISNHPLMILHTFKIRSHPSRSNNGSRTQSTTMKSPCEYAECLT